MNMLETGRQKPSLKSNRTVPALVRQVWGHFEQMQPWRAGLVIFLTGCAVRAALMAGLGSYYDLERYEVERVAIALAHRGTLADPYLIPTGPTAHAAPGYPILLAAIFMAFGTGVTAEIVKQFLSIAVASAQYALLPLAGARLRIGRRAGLLAGIVGALFPFKFSTEALGDWEAVYAALALLLLVLATASAWNDRRFGVIRGAGHGIAWGLTLLIAPALMPVMVLAYVAGFAAAGRDRRKSYFVFCATAFMTAALCLAPWALRNERLLGAPIATRSNLGLELHLSNNDMATPLEPLNYRLGVYDRFHPLQNVVEAEAVRDMGEVAYNRERQRRAVEWIRSHPGKFVRLTALRVLYTWFPHTSVPVRDAALWALTLGFFAGMVGLWRREKLTALLLTCCVAGYTPFFGLIHVNVRHRYPIDWIILLTAAYFAVSLAARILQPHLSQRAEGGRLR